jgi:hypothetical protein
MLLVIIAEMFCECSQKKILAFLHVYLCNFSKELWEKNKVYVRIMQYLRPPPLPPVLDLWKSSKILLY